MKIISRNAKALLLVVRSAAPYAIYAAIHITCVYFNNLCKQAIP